MDLNLVKKLREKTGAGVLSCQKALEEANGDLEKAEEILRKKGEKIASSKINRETRAGIIGVYLHSNEKIAAVVELLCETDFVAKNKEFKDLAHDLAMQIAATNPLYLKPEDVPTEILEKEKEIYYQEIKDEKKPPQVIEKIVQGKLEKFYQTNCLMKQPFIKDEKITVEELIKSKIAKLGENIQIKGFKRFEI
jgi:elongation factor Ts